MSVHRQDMLTSHGKEKGGGEFGRSDWGCKKQDMSYDSLLNEYESGAARDEY